MKVWVIRPTTKVIKGGVPAWVKAMLNARCCIARQARTVQSRGSIRTAWYETTKVEGRRRQRKVVSKITSVGGAGRTRQRLPVHQNAEERERKAGGRNLQAKSGKQPAKNAVAAAGTLYPRCSMGSNPVITRIRQGPWRAGSSIRQAC